MNTPIPMRAAVSAGDWIVTSGQLGVRDGGLVDGAQAQAAQALANLRAVVHDHGAELAHVVKVNVFLASMEHYAVMNAEYAAVFSDPAPARTAIAVDELPFGALIEIEAWVHRPSA